MHDLFSEKKEEEEADRSSFLNLTTIDIFLQKSEKILREPIYRKERTELTFSASLWLIKGNLHRKID